MHVGGGAVPRKGEKLPKKLERLSDRLRYAALLQRFIGGEAAVRQERDESVERFRRVERGFEEKFEVEHGLRGRRREESAHARGECGAPIHIVRHDRSENQKRELICRDNLEFDFDNLVINVYL